MEVSQTQEYCNELSLSRLYTAVLGRRRSAHSWSSGDKQRGPPCSHQQRSGGASDAGDWRNGHGVTVHGSLLRVRLHRYKVLMPLDSDTLDELDEQDWLSLATQLSMTEAGTATGFSAVGLKLQRNFASFVDCVLSEVLPAQAALSFASESIGCASAAAGSPTAP